MKKAALAALLAALSTVAVASAQHAEPTSAALTVPGAELKRLDLQFDGLPLPEVINYLSETTGRNIVLLVPRSIDANAIIVPTMKLRHVSLEQVLELVTTMPGVEMNYDVSGEGESAVYQVRVERIDEIAVPPTDKPARGAEGRANAEPYLTVVSLERELFGENPADRIPDDQKRAELLAVRTRQALALMDQAFAMNPQGETKPEIKLHPETNTLLVKATQAQVQTIVQVLGALEVPGPSKEDRDFDRQKRELIRDFEAQQRDQQNAMDHKSRMMEERIMRSQMERDVLEKRLQGMIEQVEQLKAQLKAATIINPQPQ